MSEIDFLSSKDKGGGRRKKNKEDQNEIGWSKPINNKTTKDEEKSFGWLSFFKKGKPEKGLKEDGIDEDKIEYSRKKVLKLTKEPKGKHNNKSIKAKIKERLSLSSWWNKFNKSKNTDHLVNIKQSFNNEGVLTPQKSANQTEEKGKEDQKNVFYQASMSRSPEKQKQEKTRKQTKKEIGKKENVEKREKVKEETETKGEKWENPDILETNLIEDEIVFLFNWRKGVIKLFAAIITTCLIIGVIYSGLIFWQKQKEEQSKIIVEKFIKLNNEIRQAEKGIDEILAFHKKLKLVSALLDTHIYWTNFFKFLEDHTVADVYFHGFSGNTGGNYSLSAVGNNYHTIFQQIKTLKESNQVIKAEVTKGNYNQVDKDGKLKVSFVLQFSVDPELFYK